MRLSNTQAASKKLATALLVVVLPLSAAGGCTWFGQDKLGQYRAENERLLQDYRTQRDLSARLEVQNRALVGRVSELENRLATISNAVRDPLAGIPSPSASSNTANPTSLLDPPSLPNQAILSSSGPPTPSSGIATDPWGPAGKK